MIAAAADSASSFFCGRKAKKDRCWADDELRSVNGQVEFLLRKKLVEAGRLPRSGSEGGRARGSGGTTPSEPVNGDESALS